MNTLITPLIDEIVKAVPMVVRSAPDSGNYLEGVLSRQDLKRCYEMLQKALGPPTKDFGVPSKFAKDTQKLIDRVGGIWLDQCLFLKQDGEGEMTYAALWPWASDPTKITLKVGIIRLFEVKSVN